MLGPGRGASTQLVARTWAVLATKALRILGGGGGWDAVSRCTFRDSSDRWTACAVAERRGSGSRNADWLFGQDTQEGGHWTQQQLVVWGWGPLLEHLCKICLHQALGTLGHESWEPHGSPWRAPMLLPDILNPLSYKQLFFPWAKKHTNAVYEFDYWQITNMPQAFSSSRNGDRTLVKALEDLDNLKCNTTNWK